MATSSPAEPAPTRPLSPGFFEAHRGKLIALLVVSGVTGLVAFKLTQPAPVTVMPVVRGQAIDAVYATGTVEADDRVNVKAKAAGSIAELLVKEGERVKKGALLARIDNPVVTYDLKRGKVDLSAASAQASKDAPQLAALRASAAAIQAELTTARTDLGRAEELVSGGALPAVELDRARTRVAQLTANLAANEAQQRALRIDLSANAARQAAQVESLASRVADTEVRAPIDGVVLSRSIELGEVVAINQTLFKVGDTSKLLLEVSVDEADVGRVSDGAGGQGASVAAVSLYAFPREIFSGTVTEVLPDANRDRKAFLVKVRLDKPPRGLRSGMSAEVNIIADKHDGVLLAPSEAEAAGEVWVVEGGRARKRPVKVGIRDLLRVEALTGLAEGDRVVIEGQDKLKEGKRVTASERTPDKRTPLPDKTQPSTMSVR